MFKVKDKVIRNARNEYEVTDDYLVVEEVLDIKGKQHLKLSQNRYPNDGFKFTLASDEVKLFLTGREKLIELGFEELIGNNEVVFKGSLYDIIFEGENDVKIDTKDETMVSFTPEVLEAIKQYLERR